MKRYCVLAILALVLVFGLVLVGCSSGTDESPELTEIHVLRKADWYAGNFYDYTTTVAANEEFAICYIGKNPYAELTKFGTTIKRGATVIGTVELNVDTIVPKSERFFFLSGNYSILAGTYTIETYVVDAKGNKSNTKTVTLTVTG